MAVHCLGIGIRFRYSGLAYRYIIMLVFVPAHNQAKVFYFAQNGFIFGKT